MTRAEAIAAMRLDTRWLSVGPLRDGALDSGLDGERARELREQGETDVADLLETAGRESELLPEGWG